MSRIRKSKSATESVVEGREEEAEGMDKLQGSSPRLASVTRDGVPVICAANGDKFHISDVRGIDQAYTKPSKDGTRVSRRVKKESVVLTAAPSARDSAFSGPPRYDWIDIETSAAIKVQSVFRRNQAIAALEAKGVSTSAMRNRNRKRRTRSRNVATTEDAPGLFQCCGLGLMFGDASEEDDAANRAYSKAQYEERRKLREDDEARKRQYKSRAKDDRLLCEAVEAVY